MKAAAVVIVCALLAGCASPGSFCSIYSPIYDHKNDTKKTREQILIMNAKWLKLCKPLTSLFTMAANADNG